MSFKKLKQTSTSLSLTVTLSSDYLGKGVKISIIKLYPY